MLSRRIKMLAYVVVCVTAGDALAQQGVPFFAPGATSFSPEISVINSGILQDVQATVTPDRRYVTLGMRPQSAQLLALKEFSVNGPPPAGFVGGVQVEPATGDLGSMNAPVTLGPGRGSLLLRQRGMTPLRAR